ncbi:MAG: hypothetical protein L3J69_00310 [Desulfobacula sp.]|nr:hypothetical protein [Desulfobacula sp.]
MTKYIIIILSLLMITLASSAWAETLTIDGTNSGGVNLVFTTSPSTTMVSSTSATGFYIGSASTKTTTSNGIEYAMISGTNSIYQKVQATDYACTAASTTYTTAPSGYTIKGGS